jgi:hypothetical protein
VRDHRPDRHVEGRLQAIRRTAGGAALSDGVRKTAADFKGVSPYLDAPLPGNFNK